MVAGSSYARSRTVLALVLYLAGISAAIANRGDLDPSFGTGGRAYLDVVREHFEGATSVIQAADGKLLIGRRVINRPIADHLSIVRLNPNGTLDSTFGTAGRAFVDLPANARGVTRAVLELADGRLVAAGQVTNEGGILEGFGLARYGANGAVDPTFGTRGVVTGTLHNRINSFEAVAEQTDGRLVAAGYGYSGSDSGDMVAARFNVDGTLDPAFGENGVRKIDFFGAGQRDFAWDLVLQPDGRLVIAGGAVDAAGARNFALARLMPDGSLDATFGTGGLAAIGVSGLSGRKISLELQGDGKLVVSGHVSDASSGKCGAAVARTNTDGSPDLTFNGAGIARVALGQCTTGTSTMVLEPDGGIVVAGTGAVEPYYLTDLHVRRLTSAGEIDDTFGVNGRTIVDMGSGSWSSRVDIEEGGLSMVRQTDGRIVLTASDRFDWNEGGAFFTAVRLLAAGASVGFIGFANDYINVPETAGELTVVARRTGGSAGAVSVDFETELSSSGSAGVADFTPARGTLIWPSSDASERTISIPIADDALSEGSELLTVRLFNATGGPFLATSRMTIIIRDDEPPPTTTPRIPDPQVPGTPSQPPAAQGGGGAIDWLLIVVLVLIGMSRRLPPRTTRA